MSKSIVTIFTGTLLLLILSNHEVLPQSGESRIVRFMFYNVENLFDIYDNSASDDDEFLPDGERRWNSARYNDKINYLSKIILAAGEWSPPAVVAFCEVENRKVLEDLIYRTNLSKYDYDIIHSDSPDPRGIDVCMIFMAGCVDVLSFRYFSPLDASGRAIATRSVLYATCLTGGDTLHLFVNHWPSRRGGVLAGETIRKDIAQMLRNKIDSLASGQNKDTGIIIMGDFNAGPDDQVVRILTDSYSSGLSMINLAEGRFRRTGTYRYRGIWQVIDQIIVSSNLVNREIGMRKSSDHFKIFSPDFLLKKDPVYPGLSPYSTWSGYRYIGGFSDHLPVLLDIMVR